MELAAAPSSKLSELLISGHNQLSTMQDFKCFVAQGTRASAKKRMREPAISIYPTSIAGFNCSKGSASRRSNLAGSTVSARCDPPPAQNENSTPDCGSRFDDGEQQPDFSPCRRAISIDNVRKVCRLLPAREGRAEWRSARAARRARSRNKPDADQVNGC